MDKLGNYISVARLPIPFEVGDRISAINVTPTHPAYSGPCDTPRCEDEHFSGFLSNPQDYLDQARKAILVINRRPSIPEPHFTEQTEKEVKLMQKLVADLLGVSRSSILPFSPIDINKKDQDGKNAERYKSIRQQQENLRFLVAEGTYSRILKKFGLSGDRVKEVEHGSSLFSMDGTITSGMSDKEGNPYIRIL